MMGFRLKTEKRVDQYMFKMSSCSVIKQILMNTYCVPGTK